ncbi:TonB-dependent receptor [Acetobacter persici]|uniref:TonB-dependent receptor n=1 Tax=Acetobacter persici TaxID=1076596 RepID=A0A6V8I8H5_9PROT|nr:TonB-dependent receptor [Acetobacter persici]GFE93357.1 TonB-dependent receptor [Acetobacter persici]
MNFSRQEFFIPQSIRRVRSTGFRLALPMAMSTLLFSPLVRAETVPEIVKPSEQVKKDKKTKKQKDSEKTVAAVQKSGNSSTETLTVTGTRLSQSRLTNVMAGVTVGADQVRKRGYTDLGLALLRENTAFSLGDQSPIGGQGLGAGQSFVSLLGLGSQRTLTLIDGMRMVGGASASVYGAGSGSQVDVSAIPTSLIKSMDTRIGGAGAAYGADAVAGVVNYQLDDHFTGVDMTAQGGWTQSLIAPSEKITFKYGHTFDHDKGGAVLDIEYRNAGGVVYNDLPNTLGSNATSYQRGPLGVSTPYTYMLEPSARNLWASVTGIPGLTGTDIPIYKGVNDGIANAAGQPLMFSQDGKSLVPVTWNYLTKTGYNASGGNGLATRDYNQLYAPSSQLNLTTLGHYDFTDHLHATWQGWYARSRASSQVGQGTWTTPYFGDGPLDMDSYLNTDGSYGAGYHNVNGAYTLSTDNPYLTDAERTTIKNALAANGLPTDKFYLSRLNQDLDGGMYRTDMQMFRFQGGLAGDFNALGRHFNWSLRGQYSKYMSDTWQPMINTQNLINALNSTRDASGNIVCAPGYQNSPAATRSETCAPFNPFGTDQLTLGAKNYIISDAHYKNSNAQRDFQAEINSTVLKLPAGDVRWDLGYEHRREGYTFNPGSFFAGEELADGSRRQYGNVTAMPYTSGSYYTHEAFGELDVPLVSPAMNVPGVYSLSATANGRYIRNSMTGSYWTYMFGGAWWPTQDLGLSGNYAQSVRNPSVTELFSPQSTSYETADDPCDAAYVNSGPNPTVRALNCAKAHVPSGFVSNITNGTVKGTTGGNRGLQNETSHSYTGSLEFRPHFIRGFDLKGSFVDVKINNEITSLSAENLIQACYDSSSYPSNAYCNTFTRDSSTHQITGFTDGYFNIANQHMQALQGALSYVLPLYRVGLSENAGTVAVNGNYTHYVKNSQTYLGNTYYQVGTTGSPNDLFTLNLNYTRGPLSVQWQTIFYGKSQYAVQVAKTAYEHNDRPSFAYFNATFGYEITKNFDANFMINNITNALPKYPGTVSVTRYYEALIGRSFQLNLGAHF